MSDRGEYRSIRTVIIDGPDYQKLTPRARLVFFTLKLQLGPTGIGVLNAASYTLAPQTGYSPNVVERALTELRETGWVRSEKNIFEIVGGLKHEPSVQPSNQNHVKSVRAYIAGLPKLEIVKAFKTCHPDWFDTSIDMASTTHDDVIGDAIPHPKPITEDGRPKTEDRKPKTEDGAIRKPSRKASGKADQVDSQTASPRDRFLEKFYHDATNDRRKEVIRQLDQALKPEGVQLARNHVVRAKSPEHLNRCISAVLRSKPLRKPDSAVVVVLKKLDDPDKDNHGSPPLADEETAASADDREHRALLSQWEGLRMTAVASWGNVHVNEAEAIAKTVRRESGDKNGIGYRAALLIAMTTAAGFPDFDTWAAQRRKNPHPTAETAGASTA